MHFEGRANKNCGGTGCRIWKRGIKNDSKVLTTANGKIECQLLKWKKKTCSSSTLRYICTLECYAVVTNINSMYLRGNNSIYSKWKGMAHGTQHNI